MHRTRAYEVPSDTRSALDLVSRRQPSAFLAGGTSRRLRRPDPELCLIDLCRLGLDGIDVGPQTFRIGATAPLERILEHFTLRTLANGVLAQALQSSGPPVWRRHATLGGRLLDPDSDDALGATLGVLGARAVWQAAADGPLDALELEALVEPREGLLHALEFDALDGWRFALESLRVVRSDSPCVSVAVGLRAQGGRVRDIRIAAGGAGLRLRRCATTEASLRSVAWPQESFAPAQNALLDEIQPPDDTRGSAAFRTHAAGVLLARALRSVATDHREEG